MNLPAPLEINSDDCHAFVGGSVVRISRINYGPVVWPSAAALWKLGNRNLELQDYVRVLRARWIIIAATTAIAILAALAYSLLTTPIYEASTRLFVSTSQGASVTDA